jgi:hypothetical protein
VEGTPPHRFVVGQAPTARAAGAAVSGGEPGTLKLRGVLDLGVGLLVRFELGEQRVLGVRNGSLASSVETAREV